MTDEEAAALAALPALRGRLADGVDPADAVKVLDTSKVWFWNGRPVVPAGYWDEARKAHPALFRRSATDMTGSELKDARAQMRTDDAAARRARRDAAVMRRLAEKWDDAAPQTEVK